MKYINLTKEFEKIFLNKKYFIKYNRKKKLDFKNYYNFPKDPDGKVRNLIKEEKYKLSQIKIIMDYLNKFSNFKKKILDVGCGYGWMLKNLENKKWKKYGVEINDYARNIAKKNIRIYKNLELLKEKNFDVVTMIHVIEHIKEPVSYLKKIIRLIKKKGILIIETPDFDSVMARRYNMKFRLLHDKTHVSLFSADSIQRLLVDLGMQILKVEFPYFEGPFFTKKNLLKLLDRNLKISPPFYGSVINIISKKI